ncbi:unnamed protein product [Nesidiocoris tenuis]|uniref:Odorant receptor n=1 Tax=Nesidiocoris tenuis TaxID=355587 RepID=A0A6H5GI81_9HEMI|nr:unnamed protein product [Nesidiocoris tenuis]
MAGYGRIKDEEMADGLDVSYLKRSGLWEIFNHYRETGEKNSVAKMMMYYNIVVLTPFLTSCLVGPFYSNLDLEEVTATLLNPLTTVQMIIKFCLCFWQGIETQSKLLELMKKDFLKCVPPEKRAEKDRILKEAGERATFIQNLILVINCTTILFWNVLPIIRSEFARETLGLSFLGKPKGHNKILGYWFPGNIDDTPNVQILFVYEFVGCFTTGMTLTLIEILIAQNMVMLTGQFKVLMLLMSQVEARPSNVSDRLLPYIKAHQQLIEQVYRYYTKG